MSSLPPSPAATTGCAPIPGRPASTCSGGCQAPPSSRETKTWSTPPTGLTYVRAPVPSRATSRSPSAVTGPSIASAGMKRPTSADAVGARTSPAKRASGTSRRRGIGSVGLLVEGPAPRAHARVAAAGAGMRLLQPVRRAKVTGSVGRLGSAADPQAVEQHLEVPSPVELGVAHRGAEPADQRADVVDGHVVAQHPGLLRAGDETAADLVDLGIRGLARAGGRTEADQRIAQRRVGGHDLGIAPHAGGERLPGVVDLERLAQVLGRHADLLGDERLDQRVLGREVAGGGPAPPPPPARGAVRACPRA